ncbi:hypothetical protein B0A55_03701 [Friedmanniomyces simplex]|uniref:FAD-binding domain-containing protein n=1 Tax=Friedmanniomyces simplex TaxID=329884 RepID=A0A4U0XW67_9PEZI|nr:hypothetical protein B0A55_03701 [Friedmanniomyces simplex]
MEVLIIGAGTTGLLLAQGLKQAGINAIICERDLGERYKTRPREWGMTLHWASEAIARVLPPELRERIHEACCDPYYRPAEEDADLVHYAGHTGEPLFKTPAANAMSVSRSKMRRLFSEGLDIKYGRRLDRIEERGSRVTAYFEDGGSITADLVVGCDGAKSVVREMLVGKDAARVSYMDINMFNFPANFDAETARLIRSQHPIFFNCIHPKGWMYMMRVQNVKDPSDAASWLFQSLFTWQGPPGSEELDTQEKRTSWLKSKSAEYAEPWRTILSSIPADATFGIDRVTLWRPVDWSSSPLAGKVTCAGDAAHSMPPFRGQGLNNGLEDAAQLTERLVKAGASADGWREAILGYDEEMRPRGMRDVEIGRVSALTFHDYDKVLESPIAKMGIRKSRQEDVKREDGENAKSSILSASS